MKFVLIFTTLIASLVAVQAFKYKISLDTYGLPEHKIVKGEILARVYGKDLVKRTDFKFKENTFGTKMKLNYEINFDDEIEKIILKFSPHDKIISGSKQGTFGLGTMTVTDIEKSESVVYNQSWEHINKFIMVYFDKPENTDV